MATTPRFTVTLLIEGQQGGEVLVNELINKIERLLHPAVEDDDLTAPPGSPSEGDMYIPAATATGDWAGQEGNLAVYQNAGWVFEAAFEGLTAWVKDENVLKAYNGTSWVTVGP